jgi:hypothetical protein
MGDEAESAEAESNENSTDSPRFEGQTIANSADSDKNDSDDSNDQ